MNWDVFGLCHTRDRLSLMYYLCDVDVNVAYANETEERPWPFP
jgi:hypothetical protein